MLPAKKPLFEDEQSKVDEILQSAMKQLLLQRMAETSRKINETLAKKRSMEASLVSTLEAARDSQLDGVSVGDVQSISMIKDHFFLNVGFFRSQLAIMRENAFLRAKKEVDKTERKRLQQSQIWMLLQRSELLKS